MIQDHEVCAQLNLYFAKARLAEQMHAFAPELTDDGVIVLKKARHPLIPYKKAVPISFTLGDPYRALIITGPNTGGKTVCAENLWTSHPDGDEWHADSGGRRQPGVSVYPCAGGHRRHPEY